MHTLHLLILPVENLRKHGTIFKPIVKFYELPNELLHLSLQQKKQTDFITQQRHTQPYILEETIIEYFKLVRGGRLLQWLLQTIICDMIIRKFTVYNGLHDTIRFGHSNASITH